LRAHSTVRATTIPPSVDFNVIPVHGNAVVVAKSNAKLTAIIFFNFILYQHLKNTKILSDIKHHEVKIYVFKYSSSVI